MISDLIFSKEEEKKISQLKKLKPKKPLKVYIIPMDIIIAFSISFIFLDNQSSHVLFALSATISVHSLSSLFSFSVRDR